MAVVALFMWVSDPLLKLFPDTPVDEGAPQKIVVWCARNEHESAQFAIRATAPLPGATVRISELAHEEIRYSLPADCVDWHFVGYIPVQKNTLGTEPSALVRSAPCDIPDVLLPDRSRDLPADFTQPIWLTLFVPKDAPDGIYRGSVTVEAGTEQHSLPIEINVWPFALPDARHLYVTNWFNTRNIATAHGIEEWSDEFWAMLGQYFRNMAAHRQNVAWVPWTLIKVWREEDGRLTFDYSQFDRYVELMHECGVADRIEIQHTAHFGKDGWGGSEIVFRKLSVTDRKTGKRVTLGFENGLAKLLADLERHLAQRGWLEKAMIHVADEPSQNNLTSWTQKSRMLHKAAPRLKRIDAIEASDFGDDLEVWVPKLSHLRVWLDHYRRAQERGAEMWYYICCHPTGGAYPNRYLDYPLGKVRLLHWLNWAYGLPGYLHWGLNFWPENPFGAPPDNLPPGDTHVVYPGANGPLDSIRWETQRDSLEDYEYLWLLTDKLAAVRDRLGAAARDIDVAQRAHELCRLLVRDLADVDHAPAAIRAARQVVAEEILAADEEPLVLLTTRPPELTELVPGPIVVEVHGAVEKGTKVELNGSVRVEKNGRFAGLCFLSKGTDTVRLTVTRGARTRTLVRHFIIRDLAR